MPAILFQREASPVQVPSDFRTYLEKSLRDPFVIDLSGCNLMEVVRAYVSAKSKINPNYGNAVSCLVHNLANLQKEMHLTVQPIQVTDIFWSYFIGYLQDKGLKDSTISTVASNLKAVLRWGSRYGVKISPSFDVMRVPAARPSPIALSPDDVSHIYHFDIERSFADRRADYRATLTRVRDMFVLSCNLYQRYSDMVRIEPSCFERNIFRIYQKKTGSRAVVDIDRQTIDAKMTYAILEKYGYFAPWTGDITNYNHYLHELVDAIGFKEPVRIETKRAGSMVSETVPRCKMICSHTARRTAITLAVLRGSSLHDVKKCSGHSDIRMCDHYVRDL